MAHRPVLSAFLKAIYIASLGVTAIGVMLVRFDANELDQFGPIVEVAARFFKSHSWVVAVLPGIAWVAKYFSEKIETNWLLSVIQSALTQFCDQMFGSLQGGKDEHRATLFVRRGFAIWRTWPWRIDRHPWSGWLVPVVRSGHATQTIRSRFLAPDNAAKCEGIAGYTWRTRAIQTVTGQAALTAMSSEADLEVYCQRTKTSMPWLRERLKAGEELPRALRGIPVEVDNKLWGVIVLDSKEPQPFSVDRNGQGHLTRMFSFTISKLLERARV